MLNRSEFRYVASGLTSAAIEYGLFVMIFGMSGILVLANSLSFAAGLVISFILHKAWSFGGSQEHTTSKQFIGYGFLALINLILTNLFIIGLVEVLLIAPLIAKVAVMALIVVWNFFIMKRILFKEARS